MGWITSGMLPTMTTRSAASPPAPRPTTMTDDTTCSQPHEQLLVGWIAGGTALMTTAHPTTAPPASRPHDNDEQHTTHPRPHEQLLVGWIAGGTAPTTTAPPAASPPAPRPHDDDGQHTTHLQPHEQLLVGWIVGGTALTTTAHPTSSKAPRRQWTTHHLLPASRATARGVDCGWNSADFDSTPRRFLTSSKAHDNDGRHTTRPQPHEQLLVGWIAGGTTKTRSHDHVKAHRQHLRNTAGRGTRQTT
jgi:hypothetical protein